MKNYIWTKKLFLYDASNYITQTFYTELNKKLQIDVLISTSAVGIQEAINLVRPEGGLKFNVVTSKYMLVSVFFADFWEVPSKAHFDKSNYIFVNHVCLFGTKLKRIWASWPVFTI